MKNKITLLIVASITGLIALSVIQGYLINNTYRLKKDSFIGDSKKSTTQIDDNSPKMDSIHTIWNGILTDLIIAYKKEEIGKDSIIHQLKLQTKSLNKDFKDTYQNLLAKKNIEYGLRFQKRVKAIVVMDSVQNDTIFFSDNASTFHLFGDEFEIGKGYRIGRSSVETGCTFNYLKAEKPVSERLDYHVVTENLMNIDDWEKNIFNEMKGLLLVSILIFLFVFGLLYFSIKNLIRQKKIVELKTDFINNITHEFKTPLATLSLATKMLKTKSAIKEFDEIDDTLDIIERQNRRLQKLTDQVLNNALSYQEIQLKKEPINAHNYLLTLLNDFELSTEGENVCVTKDLQLKEEIITIDKFYITTMIFNILENAIKYNNRIPKIHCKANINEQLTISIQDNGIGISEENQKQLFDKFYRFGNQEIHDVKGLGLGLYYANQIVKAHRGAIKIESEIGKGTTFIIKFPVN